MDRLRTRRLSLPDRSGPGSCHHRGSYPGPVVGRSLKVGGNVGEPAHREPAELLGGDSAHGLADDGVLGHRTAQRRRTEAEQADTAPRHAVIVIDFHRDRGARDGEIAVAAGEFLDGET